MEFSNIPVISVAWTGIAATLLKNGRTVRTTFKLPLDIDNSTTSGIKPNSSVGEKLKITRVFIWDEITMTSKAAFEVVDKLFKDLEKS